MYGDPTAIRRLASGLRELAAEIRTEADRLVSRTDAVGWLGEAGGALRERVRDRALALRRSAVLHDDAADALERHAREVERLQRLIEEIERRVHRLVDAARDKLDDWTVRVAPRLRPTATWQPSLARGGGATTVTTPEVTCVVDVSVRRGESPGGWVQVRSSQALRGGWVTAVTSAGSRAEVACWAVDEWATRLARIATVPVPEAPVPAGARGRGAARGAARSRRGHPHPPP